MTNNSDLESRVRNLASRIFSPHTDADHELMWVAAAFFIFGWLIGG